MQLLERHIQANGDHALLKSMADIGLNENLSVGKREFHIQTATLVDDGVVRTEVFEHGRLLFVENHLYERRNLAANDSADGRLRTLVDRFHQSVIEEIDSLFDISERLFKQENASAHEKIGQVFLHTHIFDRAEKHFLKAMELDRNRYSSFIYLGRCYYWQKRYNEAIEILSQLINRQVRYPDMYNLMGLVMMEKKNFRQALQYFKEALKRNPKYIEAYFNLAEAIARRLLTLTGEKRETEARKSVEFLKILMKKIDHHGKADDQKQCALVNKALVRRDLKKALAYLHEYREEKFVRTTPPEITGYKFYLRLLFGREEISEELLGSYEKKLARAVQEQPDFPDLWYFLALIHLMQCRYFFLRGLDNFRDATRINPQFDRAVKNLRLVENDGREFLSLIKAIV